MAKTLQVGSQTFSYPENGENPSTGYGEEATAWAEAISNTVNTLQGPNDITVSSFSLTNNQTTPADITGLTFNVSTGGILSVKVDYIIQRIYDSGASVVVESGLIIGNFDGSNFRMSEESTGDDAGITISVTSTGQFQYISSNLANSTSNVIKFKASTIDQ